MDDSDGRKKRSLRNLLNDFDINILIYKDEIEIDKATKYIKSLTEEEIDILENADIEEGLCYINSDIDNYIYVCKKIKERYSKSNNTISLFGFDSGTELKEYKEFFEVEYQTILDKAIPEIINRAFEAINEISEHYRLFESFYDIRSQEIKNSIIEDAGKIAKINAEIAFESHGKPFIKDFAKTEVENNVKEKMEETVKKLTESNVTLMSIFSAVVITVFGGISFSGSSLEALSQIKKDEIYNLLISCCVVGFVVINLMAVMFMFIERIRTSGKKSNCFTLPIIFIDLLFIGLILFFLFQL